MNIHYICSGNCGCEAHDEFVVCGPVTEYCDIYLCPECNKETKYKQMIEKQVTIVFLDDVDEAEANRILQRIKVLKGVYCIETELDEKEVLPPPANFNNDTNGV